MRVLGKIHNQHNRHHVGYYQKHPIRSEDYSHSIISHRPSKAEPEVQQGLGLKIGSLYFTDKSCSLNSFHL